MALGCGPCSAEDSSSSGSHSPCGPVHSIGADPRETRQRWGVEPWRGAAYPERPGAPGASVQGPPCWFSRAQAQPAGHGQARAILQDPHPSTDEYLLISP